MEISEMLKQAQYSRITVGYRWLIWTGRWEVLERLPRKRSTKRIIETPSEGEAVYHLLQGEDELYSDVILKAKSFRK